MLESGRGLANKLAEYWHCREVGGNLLPGQELALADEQRDHSTKGDKDEDTQKR